MIYLDSSALVTLVVQRPHVGDLERFLEKHEHERTCTSTLGFIETVRTCDRIGSFPHLMATLLSYHEEIQLTGQIRDAAAVVTGSVRSLDAIHIASARMLGSDLIALVTYDRRMADAAHHAGLPVVMPGMT